MTYSNLEEALAYSFQSYELLERALTHKSYSYEKKWSSLENNERLEFLGDAVLELSLTEYLMEYFSSDSEGALSKKRASLVNEVTLNELAQEMELHKYLRLGKGEVATGGHTKPRLLASALEAVFGAVYKDGGYEKVSAVVKRLFGTRVEKLLYQDDYQRDFKTKLQEIVQKSHQTTPRYTLEKTEGPEHKKTFYVRVSVNDEELAMGIGKNKKEAEQNAAASALEGLS